MYYVPGLQPVQRYEGNEGDRAPQSVRRAAVTLRKRQLAFSNAVFSVYLDRLEGPGGGQVQDYLSVVPRSWIENNVSGIAILPECNGKFGLALVYRHPLGSMKWELPRGFIDAGETAVQAALRELKEEMGLETAEADLIPLGAVAPEPGLIAARVRLFAALRCSPAVAGRSQELGHIERRFFTGEEIAELILEDEIQDPCTIAAHLRFSLLSARKSAGQ